MPYLNEGHSRDTAQGPSTVTICAIAGLPPVDDAAGPFNTGRGLSGGESMMVKLKGWPDHIFMPEDLNAYLKSPEFLGLALKSGMHAPCVDIYQK